MDKSGIRREMRSLQGPSFSESQAVVAGLFAWLSQRLPGTVGSYMAMHDEVDLRPLVDRLPGWRWVYPRIEADVTMTFRDRDIPLERHRLGMRQPVAEGPVIKMEDLDVVLIPGLAFTRHGERLGRGSGFFDRHLPDRRNDCQTVGVTIRRRLVPSLPTEGHDVRVDWIAIEDGVIRTLPRR